MTDCPIDDYLKENGISNFDRSKKNGKYHYTQNSIALIFSSQAKACKCKCHSATFRLKSEILAGMINTNYEFLISGTDNSLEVQMLDSHINDRLLAIKGANDFKCQFGIANVQRGKYETYEQYYARINNQDSSIMCEEAIDIIQRMGGTQAGSLGIRPVDNIWIPGDAAYIDNLSATKTQNQAIWPAGLEGENILYVGGGNFWGHFPGKSIYTLDEWIKKVNGFRIRENPTAKAEAVPPGENTSSSNSKNELKMKNSVVFTKVGLD